MGMFWLSIVGCIMLVWVGVLWGRFGEYDRGWNAGNKHGKAFVYRICVKGHEPIWCNRPMLGIEGEE